MKRRFIPIRCRAITAVTSGLLLAVTLALPTTHAETGATGSARLVGEWELSGPLALVWPEHVSGRGGLLALYQDFIHALPDDIEVAVISPRPPGVRALTALGRPVRYIALPQVRDIWIRDWAGVPAVAADGRLFAAHLFHQPGHHTGRQVARARDDRETGQQLSDLLYGRRQEIAITGLGTHISHNGKDTALISNRLIGENEDKSLRSLRAILRAQAGVERVIFLPVPTGDEYGRTDGLARFVDERTVVVTQAPAGDAAMRAFTDHVEEVLRRELGRGFRIVPVPQAAEAGGNYLHFVQVGKRLFVPAYGSPADDEAALTALRRALPEADLIPVVSDHLLSLAQEGVTLNRVSAVY